jgi:hypothetical protein
MVSICAARYRQAARGLVRAYLPLDGSDIPFPDHPPPSHPQALVLRHRRQAPRGDFEEATLGVGFGQPPALNQTEIELPVSPQQVLFALGQGWHTVTLRKKNISPNLA